MQLREAYMELTCTSFSFPLLPFDKSLRQIALLDIPHVDLGAHAEGRHLQPDRIETDPRKEAEAVRRIADTAGVGIADLFPTFGHGFRDRPAREANRRRLAAFVEFCRHAGCPGITLLPGVVWEDLGQKPEPRYLSARDVVELGIEGLGTSRQQLRAYR